MKQVKPESKFVVCVSNEGYRASLIVRRIYKTIPDQDARERGLLRVIDESGEDYLFPEKLFAAINVPKTVGRRLALAT